MTPLGRHIGIVLKLRADAIRKKSKSLVGKKRPADITIDGYRKNSTRDNILTLLRREKRAIKSNDIAQLLDKNTRNINDLACVMVRNGHLIRPRPGWLKST